MKGDEQAGPIPLQVGGQLAPVPDRHQLVAVPGQVDLVSLPAGKCARQHDPQVQGHVLLQDAVGPPGTAVPPAVARVDDDDPGVGGGPGTDHRGDRRGGRLRGRSGWRGRTDPENPRGGVVGESVGCGEGRQVHHELDGDPEFPPSDERRIGELEQVFVPAHVGIVGPNPDVGQVLARSQDTVRRRLERPAQGLQSPDGQDLVTTGRLGPEGIHVPTLVPDQEASLGATRCGHGNEEQARKRDGRSETRRDPGTRRPTTGDRSGPADRDGAGRRHSCPRIARWASRSWVWRFIFSRLS